jgi:CubicO group peptidase (beta-lactamase class C family)
MKGNHLNGRAPVAPFLALLIAGNALALGNAVDRSIDSYIRDEMTKRSIPGLAIAVIWHGHIEKATGYGYADLDFSVPATSTTLFSVASVTKSFTAVGIMMLEEAGKLTLDDPITKYLDGLPASWHEVKIRQLLNHTSGIPDVMANSFTLDTIADTPEEMFRVLHDKPLAFASGSERRYNQANYMLLGLLIEKLSGKPYTQFC